MSDLTGKIAVVLGASAEGGTGWAIAEAFTKAGAIVVVGDADRLRAASGAGAARV
jgi:NAD(P)-dependent dehydrogenase (short-subunit alcohol dehydrogenase family)